MMTKDELLFECMEKAIVEARAFAKRGAKPEDIAKDLYPDKTSKSWLITVALMSSWWFKLRSADITHNPPEKSVYFSNV
jgi:hypothetical protein|tara:strand:- start:3554 stop:3790 length:237 start_codon:yes stop_codon:yes gene_type:complete